jgi:hypothetical protein
MPCRGRRTIKTRKERNWTGSRRTFRTFIQPHLSGEDPEDYDLIWGWEKFVYDKSQRVQASERD